MGTPGNRALDLGAGWRLFLFKCAKEQSADEAQAEEDEADGEDGTEGHLRAENCIGRGVGPEDKERAAEQRDEGSDEEQTQGDGGKDAGG